MEKTRVVEWVDIEASRSKVFELVLDVERRMQLSPLWGVTRVEGKTPDYPAEGSCYQVRFLKGEEPDYETVVTALLPGRKFAYSLQVSRETSVTWTLQDTPRGTRLVYEEEFLSDASAGEAFNQSVRQVIHSWLVNMKRYAELREGKLDRLIKWFLDRYFLNLTQDQRKIILTILFMQAVGTISFVMAAIALGIASLI
jgi:hypothetical protein